MRHLMADVEFRCHVFCYNVSVAVVVFVVLLCLCLVLESMCFMPSHFFLCPWKSFKVILSVDPVVTSCYSWEVIEVIRDLYKSSSMFCPWTSFKVTTGPICECNTLLHLVVVREIWHVSVLYHVAYKHASSTTSTVLESRWRSHAGCRLCLVLVPLVEGQLMTSLLAGRYRQHRDDVELVHAVIVWLCLLCIYVVVIHVARKQVVYVTHESMIINVSWEFYASISWRQSQR